jgi:hypothetical protein
VEAPVVFGSEIEGVTTTTGMSRHAGFACSAATTSKPSISGTIRSSSRMSGDPSSSALS